ncbi:flavin reductase family protein [Arthrobacter sp. 31Y]|uniref:flavin reductase family protein n=1 Tax=Arthrobacter sp. 31Y TaxID=1115632 RepID=UPI00046394D3|nr:flavin reductase family protein [Arthrobacter sp. 31Y]
MNTPSQLAEHTSTIDARRFRDTLGHYASGLTIVTGDDDGEPLGFTCQSFYSVSVEPPLISFSVMKTSTTYPRIRSTGKFAVNVLAHHQHSIANQFARSGTDKWAGITWEPTSSGNPILADSLIWIDCTIHAEYEAGDHFIVVGAVNELISADAGQSEPLLFFKGQYRHLQSTD